MSKLTKKSFLKLFDEKTCKYLAVRMEKEGYSEPEIIIIPNKNFEKEKQFYDSTYDDNLNNKFSKIKIHIGDAAVMQDFVFLKLFLGIK